MMTSGGEGSDRSIPTDAAPRRRGRTAKAFMPPTPPPLPELDGTSTYFGVPVCVAEDDRIVALGHYRNRRAVVFALNMYADRDIGLDNFDGGWTNLAEDRDNLVETWAVVVDGGPDTPGRFLRWPVDEHAEGAVPVTVPRQVDTE